MTDQIQTDNAIVELADEALGFVSGAGGSAIDPIGRNAG